MQDETQSTTRPSARITSNPTRPTLSRTSSQPRENAFSALYLERARRRDADPEPGKGLTDSPLAREAHWRGPWEVERVPAGTGWLHAATRRAEPAKGGGGARLACLRRQDTLLGAAAFAALAAPNHLSVNGEKPSGRRSPLGHPIHDGARHLGHVSPAVDRVEADFLAYFHTVRCLAANPDAAALFLEALDAETLAILGRAAARRLS
jgi:hypothetical protein